MAKSLGTFAVDMIRALGGKPTPQARRFFNAWQRWEGGWSNNDAIFNPLNLTAPGSGLPTINSVGVVSMPNYQTGVQRTAQLIASGYPALARAFRTGKVNFSDPGLQGDLNRWLSGNRTPQMTPYVSKIASSYGQKIGPAQVPVQGQAQVQGTPSQIMAIQQKIPQPPRRVFDPGLMGQKILSQFAQGGEVNISGLPELVGQSFRMEKVPPIIVQGQKVVPGQPGQMVPTGTPTGAPTGGVPKRTGKGPPGMVEAFYDPKGAWDQGQWISPIGGHSDHVHLSFATPQSAIAAMKLARRMGLRVGENPYYDTVDPVHTKTSFHYQNFPGSYGGKAVGKAADISGSSKQMTAFWNAVMRGGY